MKKLSFAIVLLTLLACNRSEKNTAAKETRTSGQTQLLVDDSFARILDDQIQVFKSDYPDAKVQTVLGSENQIIPDFLNGKVKLIVLSRMLKPNEEQYYKQKQVPVNTDRFAVDAIALITNAKNLDTNITTSEVYQIMTGASQSKTNLVFDNASSSTIRYFIDSAKIKELPKQGVYTLKTNNDVIKYVAENENYIGVVGVNWLLESNKEILSSLSKIKIMSVKNDKNPLAGYLKPTQKNLMNGSYPFLRNVFIINAEGKNGVGTGFANWLTSPRGQLIVLKSGLGPHETLSRDFNIKKAN